MSTAIPVPGDPQLDLSDRGTVRSARFQDIYFQAGDALAESRQVFLNGCNLPQQWQGRTTFTVAETGFGSGRNFLNTWSLWRQHRRPGQRLNYVSVEAYPLTRRQLEQLHGRWPALATISHQLRQQYPRLSGGYHQLVLPDQVTLTLLLGDVNVMLEELEATVDAWYLDGFAPSKNPEMWSIPVLQQVARLSCHGALLATYTLAQRVREGLTECGFDYQRQPGFGNKKERLTAIYRGQPSSGCPGWFMPPSAADLGQVTIIGGGVAGHSAAAALRRRGLAADVLDAGGGASRNPSASVMPRLDAGDSPAAQFFLHGYRYARRYWRARNEYKPCGALLLATDPTKAERLRRIAAAWRLPTALMDCLNPQECRDVSGVQHLEVSAGLWFPGAGAVQHFSPGAPGKVRVSHIEQAGKGWRLHLGNRTITRQTVILAGGATTPLLDAGIPWQTWYGNTLRIPSTAATDSLRCALFNGKYVHPKHQNQHWVGASYDRPGSDTASADLLYQLQESFPNLGLGDTHTRVWTGARQATPDRLPAAGPVLNMGCAANALRWVKGGRRGPDVPWLPGLFLLGGLGARGFTTAPLLGEWLACMLCHDPWPLPRPLALAVCSSRFLVRSLRRES